MAEIDGKLTRIGVFYDGNYFRHVSNYYTYQHQRRARLSINGLHDFIKSEVAKYEGVDSRYCQLVDVHYFRGKLAANEAEQRNKLLADRLFDDVLMREGVVTHYLPVTPTGEKGIDVWLALEMLELAVYKRFSVAVLIAGDRDFVPLIRKLNTLGTRVMLLGWSFEYMNDKGEKMWTDTAQSLLEEVTYPVLMSDVIEDRTRRGEALINNLFMAKKESRLSVETAALPVNSVVGALKGSILTLKEGYGFIQCTEYPKNLFFHHSDVTNRDFNDLSAGDTVSFEAEPNEKGHSAKQIVVFEDK